MTFYVYYFDEIHHQFSMYLQEIRATIDYEKEITLVTDTDKCTPDVYWAINNGSHSSFSLLYI